MERGDLILAHHKIELDATYAFKEPVYLNAVGWKDTKAVHFLSTGYGNYSATVMRKDKTGKKRCYQCVRPVAIYQKRKGGVDVNDQLRMASYSLQESYHMRKWYKSIYLALYDLALVNAHILWTLLHPKGKAGYLGRSDFYYKLAEGMLSGTTFTQ